MPAARPGSVHVAVPDQQCTTTRSARRAAPHPGHTLSRLGRSQHKDRILESVTASLLQDAIAHHRRGELVEAAARYAQLLRSDPANADVLYRLAQISCQQGRLAEGADLARRALAVDPLRAQAHLLLGMA